MTSLPVSQNFITRKITRAQVLAGVQTQINIPAGTILGRITAGLGSPETIAIGNYLSFTAGTLSGIATPYSVAMLPGGLIPSAADLVPLGQQGNNVSVTYSTFSTRSVSYRGRQWYPVAGNSNRGLLQSSVR